jgi:hypothetical protein
MFIQQWSQNEMNVIGHYDRAVQEKPPFVVVDAMAED